MYKVEIISERANSSDMWFPSDADMFDYIKETYEDTGKILGSTVEETDDKLRKVETIMFDSEESYNEWLTDEILVYERKYLRKHNNRLRIAHSINGNQVKVSKKLYNIYGH